MALDFCAIVQGVKQAGTGGSIVKGLVLTAHCTGE